MSSEFRDSVSLLRNKATSRIPRHFDIPKDNRGAKAHGLKGDARGQVRV